jgi:hypothetical protein
MVRQRKLKYIKVFKYKSGYLKKTGVAGPGVHKKSFCSPETEAFSQTAAGLPYFPGINLYIFPSL